MPRYEYICDSCDAHVSVVRPMSESGEPWFCTCKAEMYRDYRFHVRSCGSGSGGGYRRAIVSDSLAISPKQIAEHKRMFPNVAVTPEGQPVFDNYKDHDAYLEKCNLQKTPGKLKPDSEDITPK